MRRIQKNLLIVSLAATFAVLSGCKESAPPVVSVNEYMHNIDAAKARVHVANTQTPFESLASVEAQNASQAVANVQDPKYLKCWPKKPVITANTDHECLENFGFPRK